MKKLLIISLAALLGAQAAATARQKPSAQKATPKPSAPAPQQQPKAARAEQPTDLNDYGIQIAPDPRLIVMMAALDAAGWDPTPTGERPSVFRELLRKDQSALDPALAKRMRDFYERNALKGDAVTLAEQAARYVSLAYTLGQPPAFDAPARSDDLPAGVLDVLDFVPLLREFYKQSGMDARLDSYMREHRAAGDKLRAPAIEMARAVLAYLNTRPETVITERVVVAADPAGKKKKQDKKVAVFHDRDRRFRVVPDLLAAPGAINLRAVGDDYNVIVPADVDPRRSEARRAYIQFVIDPLVVRFNRDVSARKADIKLLLEREHARTGRDLTPDIYLAVSRSIVAAADARMDESARLRVLQFETSERLRKASDQTAREAALKESKQRQTAIEDATSAQLAEAYERGAILSFYFAEQLRSVEGGGFDIANFIPDMVANFNAERELKRPVEYVGAVARVAEARRLARAEAARAKAAAGATDERRASLLKSLSDVEDLLRVRNYSEADVRLKSLREEYRDEPLVYFALGQAASLAAQEAFDETVQTERLNAALGHFRQVVLFSTPDTDRSILLRARLASGRILAHFDRRDEAAREFDAVIAASAPAERVYQEALAEKKKLTGQQ